MRYVAVVSDVINAGVAHRISFWRLSRHRHGALLSRTGCGFSVSGRARLYRPDMASLRESLTVPPQYLTQEDPLNGLFQSMVVDRLADVPFDRAFALFIDFISAGEHRNAGYHAAATYEVEAACEQVEKPTLVIATQSSLREGTLQTADWIPDATLVERDDVTAPAFERGAEVIATLVSNFAMSNS